MLRTNKHGNPLTSTLAEFFAVSSCVMMFLRDSIHQVQETCKRTDYLLKDIFTNLLHDRLKLSELNVCWKIRYVQIVISAFRCTAEDVHFVTFFPYEQALVFENSLISVELRNYVCCVILHWKFLQQTVITVTAE